MDHLNKIENGWVRCAWCNEIMKRELWESHVKTEEHIKGLYHWMMMGKKGVIRDDRNLRR